MRGVWDSSGPSSNVRATNGESVRTSLIDPNRGWTGRETDRNALRAERRQLTEAMAEYIRRRALVLVSESASRPTERSPDGRTRNGVGGYIGRFC